MKKTLEKIDSIIRFPLRVINLSAFSYLQLSDYARDRINLIIFSIVLYFPIYHANWVVKKYIMTFNSFEEYLWTLLSQ